MTSALAADILPSPAAQEASRPAIVRTAVKERPSQAMADNTLDAWARALEGAETPAVEAKPVAKPVPQKQPEPIVVEQVKKTEKPAKVSNGEKRVKITSNRADADRKQGIILFDGNVFVDDTEYQMHSDRLYVFLEGTNELKRIVAVGNVAITNDNKMGYCAKATYSKEKSRIIMYGDGPVAAKLVDASKKKSEVVGSKITFWVDSDQVEVENSTVTLDAGGAGMKDQAKKLRNNGK